MSDKISSLIELAAPDLRQIVFHSDGRVAVKTGGKAKHPKKIYAVRPGKGLFLYSNLLEKALLKLIEDR